MHVSAMAFHRVIEGILLYVARARLTNFCSSALVLTSMIVRHPVMLILACRGNLLIRVFSTLSVL